LTNCFFDRKSRKHNRKINHLLNFRREKNWNVGSDLLAIFTISPHSSHKNFIGMQKPSLPSFQLHERIQPTSWLFKNLGLMMKASEVLKEREIGVGTGCGCGCACGYCGLIGRGGDEGGW